MKLLDLLKSKLMGKAPAGDEEAMIPLGDDRNIIERLKEGVDDAVDPEKQDKLLEKVEKLKESGGKLEESAQELKIKHVNVPRGKVFGLDIGTSRIVSTDYGADGTVVAQDQLNAFFSVPDSLFVRETLDQNKMAYVKLKEDVAILGHDAQKFANTFNSEIRRPMKSGFLKPEEPNAVPVLKEIISLLIPKADQVGRSLCFSVPAPQPGLESDLIFHEGILKKHLVGRGYNAKSITEGTAVVLSELAADNFTGIGISMGAGMCNVCFSFLAVPVIVFSLPQGGDNIDMAVARVVDETMNRVRVIKEESLDFSRTPKNNMENAFHIYYEELLMQLLKKLSDVMSAADHLPVLAQAIPIVLAGGTSSPNGFKTKFERILRQVPLPIEISEVRIAASPLAATATGALINASA